MNKLNFEGCFSGIQEGKCVRGRTSQAIGVVVQAEISGCEFSKVIVITGRVGISGCR